MTISCPVPTGSHHGDHLHIACLPSVSVNSLLSISETFLTTMTGQIKPLSVWGNDSLNEISESKKGKDVGMITAFYNYGVHVSHLHLHHLP